MCRAGSSNCTHACALQLEIASTSVSDQHACCVVACGLHQLEGSVGQRMQQQQLDKIVRHQARQRSDGRLRVAPVTGAVSLQWLAHGA